MLTSRLPALLATFLSCSALACGVGGVGTIGGTGGGAGGGGGGGTGGGGGGGGGEFGPDAGSMAPDAAPPDYALSVTPSSSDIKLNESVQLAVVVASSNFSGPVKLSLAGAPASWNVTYDPSDTVTPAADGTAQVTITIAVPSDGEAGSADLQVQGSATPGQRMAATTINVANELVVPIASGTGTGTHVFPTQLHFRLGAKVTFVNEDGTPHRIHSDSGAEGFPHEPGDMQLNDTYSFTITQTGQYNYYCHDHGAGVGVGSFVVDAAQ